MLNVFVHNIKAVLMEWSIKGDKTPADKTFSEPGAEAPAE